MRSILRTNVLDIARAHYIPLQAFMLHIKFFVALNIIPFLYNLFCSIPETYCINMKIGLARLPLTDAHYI